MDKVQIMEKTKRVTRRAIEIVERLRGGFFLEKEKKRTLKKQGVLSGICGGESWKACEGGGGAHGTHERGRLKWGEDCEKNLGKYVQKLITSTKGQKKKERETPEKEKD